MLGRRVVVQRQQLKRLENCAQRVDCWLTMKRTLLTLAVTSLLATTAFADPIHNAAFSGNIEAVKQRIAAGTDVNAKGLGGNTPLHEAAWYGRKEIMELLIARGADVNAQHDDGETPLNYAIRERKRETVALLRKHGGKTGDWLIADKSIHIAASAGHIEAVKQHSASPAQHPRLAGEGR